jgi:hypothetical protein
MAKGGGSGKFDGTKIIMGAISIIIGLVLLPLMASFSAAAKADANVAAVSGLTALIDLILYGFCFGLVGLGIGLIYIGFKG